MVVLEEISKAEAKLAQAIDTLALGVMVQGVAALNAKALSAIVDLAGACERTELAKEVKAAKPGKGKALSEEAAKALVARMQALMAEPGRKVEEAGRPVAVETPQSFMVDEDPELLGDFVLEADEHLVAIEEKILVLEKDPTLIDSIHAIFRSFHSIKGLAGFLGLIGVQTVAHEVETLLDHARNLRIPVDSAVVDLVLESSEYLREEVDVVRAKLANTSLPSVRDNTKLVEVLLKATSDVAAGRGISAGAEISAPREVATTAVPSTSFPVAETFEASGTAPLASDGNETRIEELIAGTVSEMASSPIEELVRPPETVDGQDPAKLSLVTAVGVPHPAPVLEKAIRSESGNTSIRVETSKLDRLMDMVGEMVIAQAILSNTRNELEGNVRLAGEMSQLARITSEVQRCAMSMRMMPIGPLFQKNAKMVRDLSRRHGKQVSLVLQGENTELDKTIAEELSDPLLHMIRNALDHGIETPEERVSAGKPAMASLRIGAEHQAGQIVISISDDGRGLDTERIRKKAIQNGLIEEAAQLTEQETFHLIFAPGFSTAEKITDISGRGVGMDVVRQHVESLRGRIEIESELGKGTTFLIYLPLTLAIIEGLVIVVGEHRYIIPLFSVREMLRPTKEMLFTVQGSQEMILMRGSLLPLVRLHKRFDVAPRSVDICEGLLIVCEYSGKLFCLFVDDLQGRQEVVIKSLDESFKSVRGVVGSAILGDGHIGLILDVAGIFQEPYLAQEYSAA